MPDCSIAAWIVGTSISVSLCRSSRATADCTKETIPTSLIGHSAPPSLAALRSCFSSEVVLVAVVLLVGLAGGLPPENRRVVGLELVGPLRLHAHAHVHVVDL